MWVLYAISVKNKPDNEVLTALFFFFTDTNIFFYKNGSYRIMQKRLKKQRKNKTFYQIFHLSRAYIHRYFKTF